MPSRPLRASPFVHSWETICGETIAEFCANLHGFAQKNGEMFPHFSKKWGNDKSGETFLKSLETFADFSEQWGNVCALRAKYKFGKYSPPLG